MQVFSDPTLNILFAIVVVGGSVFYGWRHQKGSGDITAPRKTHNAATDDTPSVKAIISRTTTSGEAIYPVSRLAGIGALLGIGAAVVGLLMTAGYSLFPLPTIPVVVYQNSIYKTASTIFLALLAGSLLIQGLGSSELRLRLGSNYAMLLYGAFLVGVLTLFALQTGTEQAGSIVSRQATFMSEFALLFSIFALLWQMVSVIYSDASKTWIGFLAGILNGLFIPVVAVGQILGFGIVYIGYGLLLLGQLCTLLFWWSPIENIREFARSPNKAKFAFGFSGFATFLIGAVAVFVGPIVDMDGVQVWQPWSTLDPLVQNQFVTNPALVFAFCTSMVMWIMLAPRLGAKELQAAHVGEDIIKGGVKWFMVILAALGIISAGASGTLLAGAEGMGLWLAIAPAAVMFLMGAVYAATTDIVTGIPLAVSAIFLMVHPFVIANFVIIPWIIVVITQGLLMVETYIRGLTGYSQGALTVIVSILTSSIFVMFLLGLFGSGPAAIWPTNQWFNIRLFTGLSETIQSPTVVALPILALLLRNVSLAGYSHGRGYQGGQMLMGMSALFSLMIPMIAFNAGITHIASTAAALMLALYAVSFVLVLSLNLSLATEVEETGHNFEGQFIRVSSVSGLAFGAVVLVLVLATFSGFPTALEVAFMITLLVTLVTGLEILCIISWLVAGVRLGMLREGFSYTRVGQQL